MRHRLDDHERHVRGACIAADPGSGSAGARASCRAASAGLTAAVCGNGDMVNVRTPRGAGAASPLALALPDGGGGFGAGPQARTRAYGSRMGCGGQYCPSCPAWALTGTVRRRLQ